MAMNHPSAHCLDRTDWPSVSLLSPTHSNPTTVHPRKKIVSWGSRDCRLSLSWGQRRKQWTPASSSLWPLLSMKALLPIPERPQSSHNLKVLPHSSSLRGLPKLTEALCRRPGTEILFVSLLLTFFQKQEGQNSRRPVFFRPLQGGLFISQIEWHGSFLLPPQQGHDQ